MTIERPGPTPQETQAIKGGETLRKEDLRPGDIIRYMNMDWEFRGFSPDGKQARLIKVAMDEKNVVYTYAMQEGALEVAWLREAEKKPLPPTLADAAQKARAERAVQEERSRQLTSERRRGTRRGEPTDTTTEEEEELAAEESS